MLFSWLKRRRRKKLLAAPFPDSWGHYIEALPFYKTLDEEEKSRLRQDLTVIVHEKAWEGCGGLELTEEIQVTIAAQAALPLLHIDHDYYRRVQSILVYPSTFVVPDRGGPVGMVMAGATETLGEAWHRGPVVLAWDASRHGSINSEDGHNLVLHEFAHQLDMLDDAADGTPISQGRGAVRGVAPDHDRGVRAVAVRCRRGSTHATRHLRRHGTGGVLRRGDGVLLRKVTPDA